MTDSGTDGRAVASDTRDPVNFYWKGEIKQVDIMKGTHTFDTVSKFVFWSHLVNKLEPWHNIYIRLDWQTPISLANSVNR